MFESRCLYILICRDVSTDATDGMNSINKIIDRFTFGVTEAELESKLKDNRPISVPANFYIATSWFLKAKTKDTTKVKLIIEMIDAKGNNLGGPTHSMDVQAGSNRVAINIGVNGFPLLSSGQHLLRAELAVNGNKINGEYPFDVVLQKK